MTNGTSGSHVLSEVAPRIAAAYKWDSQDKPIPR